MNRHDKVGLGTLLRYRSPLKFASPNYEIGLVVKDDLGSAQVQVLIGNKKQWWNKEDLEEAK